MLIDRTGTFRGRAKDSGVSLTAKGLPQFVMKLIATEYYDEASKSWIPWDDVDQNEITAFLCLFSHEGKPVFHVDSLMETFGWDGTSLSGLSALDISNEEFQFNVTENVYQGESRLQVSGVAPYSATPGGGVRGVDTAELKKLDTKFAAALIKNSGGKKPAKSPAKKVDMPAPPKKKAAPPKREAAATAEPAKKFTMEQAWERCVEAKLESTTEEQLAESWTKACFKVAGDKEDEDITKEQWAKIAEIVIEETGDPLPF